MLFSELCKIMMKKVTFVGFRGNDRPNRSFPLDPPLVVEESQENTKIVRRHEANGRF